MCFLKQQIQSTSKEATASLEEASVRTMASTVNRQHSSLLQVNGLGFILFTHHQYLNVLHLYNKFPRACQVQVKCVGLNNPEESYVITAYTDSSCIHEVSLQHLGHPVRKQLPLWAT